ncbi:MAG: glycosyltransferase [Solirubrobacterales bacterium]
MRVLIFHGYLLRGTGSNVYNANLAPALAGLGHDVHLLCQDRRAGELEWVNRYGDWSSGSLQVEELRPPQGAGSVTVYVPEIGGLLPVYVADEYEGFEVKTFPGLSEAELERYIKANVRAVGDVVAQAGEPDAALANHLIMGPVILVRAGVTFATKVHGSDLSYTVLPHRRFVAFAEEGMRASRAALVGSRHTAEQLWEAVGDPGLPYLTRLGPPGVDVEAFAERAGPQATDGVRELAARLEESDGALSAFGRDPAEAATALESFASASGPRVLFVGKLIVSKGPDLLLAAWPLVVRENPGARLLLAGFGEFKDPLALLWGYLTSGNFAAAQGIAARGRGLEGAGADQPLRILSGFLKRLPAGYAEAAGAAADTVSTSGRLEHSEIAEVMPAADALVMPSTFPEAFGMVAVEAAAAGVLPVSADHSGMLEVTRLLAESVEPEVARLLSFRVDEHAVTAIAERLNGWFGLPEPDRRRAGEALARRAAALWSWENVAQGVIDASQGRLDRLASVPGE